MYLILNIALFCLQCKCFVLFFFFVEISNFSRFFFLRIHRFIFFNTNRWDYLQSLSDDPSKLSPVWLGLSVAAVPATRFLSAPIYGRLLDRYPIYYLVIFSLLMATIGSFYYSMAKSPIDVVIARGICGIGNLMTINNTYIGIAIRPDQQTRWATKIGGISKIGMLVAPALNLAFVKIDFNLKYFGAFNQLTMPGWTMGVVCIILLILMPIFYFEPDRSGSPLLAENVFENKNDEEDPLSFIDEPIPQVYTVNSDQKSIDKHQQLPISPLKAVDSTAVDYDTSSMSEVPNAELLLEQEPLWKNTALIALTVSKFCSQFLQMVFETMITPISNKVFHFTPVLNSLFYAGCAVLAIFSIAIVGVFSHRVSDRTFIYISQALFGCSITWISWRWYYGIDHSFVLGLMIPGVFMILALPFSWSPVAALGMVINFIFFKNLKII